MGKDISKVSFTKRDFSAFSKQLDQQLIDLKKILEKENFGEEPLKIGAELELYLVDDLGNPSLSNQQLLTDIDDHQFQPELNQYNIELNLNAYHIKGKPFSRLRAEILEKSTNLERVAAKHNINIVPVGILPTLRSEHLTVENMTDLSRYHCLSDHLYQQRGEPFRININGEEPLSESFSGICAEGANTSFQVHLMAKFVDFNNIFNAAQLTTPLVTAIAGNSSILLGHKLWDETRIALFKQSLDIRAKDPLAWQTPTRVNFGQGWLRKSVWELFAEAVAVYPPILADICANSRPSKQDNAKQKLPPLHELCLHMGTIWPWNRPVYDYHGNGHMRIEFRSIPAGPTSIDMVANAAFAIGLASGLADKVDDYLAVIPFSFAEDNFYRAAQDGLQAKIHWPLKHKFHPSKVSIIEVIEKMLPVAKKGLYKIGIDKEEADYFLSIIEQRLNKQVTGAVWQKQTLKVFEKSLNKDLACQKLVLNYIKQCRSCQPVATWDQIWK